MRGKALVAQVRLGSWRLGMWPVADPRLLRPTGDHLLGS